eukprot:gnl/MRDRNA2_/MRDRNA2_17454_c0_seq1.p1 gnl/MRDRNA2_/MRDRNA2_17454_c0~~gnl/MRDRNA2_/MRDRNA2_17454_c0_seq1.p1  ORF type:complete len:534 (+),score=134.73 gnl/MRDRNA2_/MRDRNA2_17454_c0_seq1:80-1681(+)
MFPSNHVFALFFIFASASAARVKRTGARAARKHHGEASQEAGAGVQFIHNATGNATELQTETSALLGAGWMFSGFQLFQTARGHYKEAKEVYHDVFEGKIIEKAGRVGHKIYMAKKWPDMANELVASHSQAVDLLVNALDTQGGSTAADSAMSKDEWALTKQVGNLIQHADQRCSKQLQFQWTRFAAEFALKKAEAKGYDLPPVAAKILNKFKPKVSDAQLQAALVSIHAASRSYQASLNEFRVKALCPPLQHNVTSSIEKLGAEIQEWENITGYSWHEQLRWEKIDYLSSMDGPSFLDSSSMLDYVYVPDVPEQCVNTHDNKNYPAGASLETGIRQRMYAVSIMLQSLASDCPHLEVSAWLHSSKAKQVAKCSADLDGLMTSADNQIKAQKEKEMKETSNEDEFMKMLLEPVKEKAGFDWDALEMPPLVTKAQQYFKEYLAPVLNMVIKQAVSETPKIIETLNSLRQAMPQASKDAAHLATLVSVGAAAGGPLAAVAWVRSVNHLASRFVDNIDVRSDCLELAELFDETQKS